MHIFGIIHTANDIGGDAFLNEYACNLLSELVGVKGNVGKIADFESVRSISQQRDILSMNPDHLFTFQGRMVHDRHMSPDAWTYSPHPMTTHKPISTRPVIPP